MILTSGRLYRNPSLRNGGENDFKKAVVPTPPPLKPSTVLCCFLPPIYFCGGIWVTGWQAGLVEGFVRCRWADWQVGGGGVLRSARCVTPFKLDEKQYVNFTHTIPVCLWPTAEMTPWIPEAVWPLVMKSLLFLCCLCWPLRAGNDSVLWFALTLPPLQILNSQWQCWNTMHCSLAYFSYTVYTCSLWLIQWPTATLNQSFLQPWTTCQISSISQAEQMADVIFHMPFTGYLTQQPLLAAINTEHNIHDTSNPSIRPQTDVPRTPLMFQPVTTPLLCQSTNDWLVSSWQCYAVHWRT